MEDNKKRKFQLLRDKNMLYYFYPLKYHLIKQFWKLSSRIRITPESVPFVGYFHFIRPSDVWTSLEGFRHYSFNLVPLREIVNVPLVRRQYIKNEDLCKS